jgi:FkbM family methyltransferase
MHFNLLTTLQQTSKVFTGVIQGGAHYGQEVNVYDQMSIPNRILFEPVSSSFSVLEQHYGNRKDCSFMLEKKALGNENKMIDIFVETHNQGQSNSLLKPAKHLNQFPDITFDNKEEVEMVRLDDWMVANKIDSTIYNLLILDVQGYEMEVLKGAIKTLQNVEVVVAEILREELYEGCVMHQDLEMFLNDNGFHIFNSNWVGGSYGDAVFVRN